MFGKKLECLMNLLEALLELSLLVIQVGEIKDGLEQVIRRFRCLNEVVFALLHIGLAQLKHAQVVKRFSVGRIEADGDFVGLVGEAEVAYADANVPDIVPYVGLIQIIREWQSSLKATQCHVILTCIEATETHIVPQLGGIDTTLEQSLVESESNLWLVCVEVV